MVVELQAMERYRRFSTYLKERFSTRVHKIGVDAGFSCPNRDGKISNDGCIYCNNAGFSFHSRSGSPLPLRTQIKEGIRVAKKRFKAERFIVYFQAYTNTYGLTNILKERYDTVKGFDNIVGISIATRPDCIDNDILELLAGYKYGYDVWLEYGLQSIHDKTLEFINRGHKYEDFLKALDLTREYGIRICVHIIIGLPYETRDMMMETAKEMARLKIDSIKLHPLHIIKNTKLEELYRAHRYNPLEQKAYLDIVSDFLGYLWPKTVIERIRAFCPKEFLIAPEWVSKRNVVEEEFERLLIEKDYKQGIFYKEA